ncbi:hypothetical protein ERO13_D05G317900v2 [Gossypium hirsutum]|nr:hypothetical protein ERO13_D05G317900v2 [Gossypium hirsutum]
MVAGDHKKLAIFGLFDSRSQKCRLSSETTTSAPPRRRKHRESMDSLPLHFPYYHMCPKSYRNIEDSSDLQLNIIRFKINC